MNKTPKKLSDSNSQMVIFHIFPTTGSTIKAGLSPYQKKTDDGGYQAGMGDRNRDFHHRYGGNDEVVVGLLSFF